MHPIDEGYSPENPRELEELNFFVENLCGAEMHWFFIQAVKAMRHELYIPACSCFLNGIEASIRTTIAQLDTRTDVEKLSPYKLLSNVLLNNARELGMPVELLSFENENNFLGKLATSKPNRVDVEVVRVRNNICHGNVLEFVNSDLGEDMKFFTPECLRDVSKELHGVSKKWVVGLGAYRREALGV